MSLYAHRLARIIERRSLEAARPDLTKLDGMTHDEYAAAHGLKRFPYVSARQRNRSRAGQRQRVLDTYAQHEAATGARWEGER